MRKIIHTEQANNNKQKGVTISSKLKAGFSGHAYTPPVYGAPGAFNPSPGPSNLADYSSAMGNQAAGQMTSA